jgi:hypothetical protein
MSEDRAWMPIDRDMKQREWCVRSRNCISRRPKGSDVVTYWLRSKVPLTILIGGGRKRKEVVGTRSR